MRRLLIGLAALLAVAAGASFAVWRWAEGQLEAQLADWVMAQQAQGWTLAHGTAARGGWPLAAELTLPDATLTGLAADLPHGVAWSAERLILRVSLLSPHVLEVLPGGAQRLRLGATAPVAFAASRLAVTVPLGSTGVATLDASGVQLANGASVGLLQGDWEQRDGEQRDGEQRDGEQRDGEQRAAPPAEFRVAAEAIAFPPPPAPQPALGSHIASLSADGTLSGTLPASPAAWQQAGGRLTVRRLALGWGPLGVSGTAECGLDAALQPAGTAKLHLVGYAEALSALAAGHVISSREAQAAGAVLGLLATAPADGGAPAVDVPLTLEHRALSMGHIPLARLPELLWPGAGG